MKRSESREALFLLLFETSFDTQPDAEQIITLTEEEMGLETDEYSRNSFKQIVETLPELDAEIEPYLKGRALNRLSRVALAALRIAFFEIKNSDDVPSGVAINEAVELVKKYDVDSQIASYVNGVLGTYVKAL